MVWANVSLFVRDTELLFSFHHHVFTKNCFQPAQRSCGFLRKVCMTCRAIINCQPYYHHCLPRLPCQASCTSPAFAVVRRTWDDTIPTDSSFSSQSLLLPLDHALNNVELLTRRIGKTLRHFQGQAVFPFTDVLKNPCLFSWFNHDGAARPNPRVFPSITTN